jgi:hypothetical protein
MKHKAIGIQKFIALSPFNLAGNGRLLFLGGTMWLVLPSLNNKRDWQSSILLAQGLVNSKGFRFSWQQTD